jgi:flagellar basal-body rod protein FlgF
MIRGLYSCADGLLVQAARTDTIAANLAGVGVAGFRRDIPTVEAFAQTLQYTSASGAAGIPGGYLLTPAARTDLQPGPIKATGRDLDLALEGDGYFCVQTPGGEAYTRAAALRLDPGGRLLTAAGDPVLGQTGPVRVTGAHVEFRENGDVIADGARIDRLKLAHFPPIAPMVKLGRGLLRADPAQAIPHDPTKVRVRQGYLEGANVEAVTEMASMISALRAFEASQRALQANDQTLQKVINEVARP